MEKVTKKPVKSDDATIKALSPRSSKIIKSNKVTTKKLKKS